MAKRDTPSGFVYDSKTRGAYNPETGEKLSRREVEKTRLAREIGTRNTRNIFERKREKRARNEPTPISGAPIYRGRSLGKARALGLAPLPPPKQPRILPRTLKVHYKGRGKNRYVVENQNRYRIPHAGWDNLKPIVDALPPNASISIRVRGRYGYPLGESPDVKGRNKEKLRWITANPQNIGKIRADEFDEHEAEILDNIYFVYDIRTIDVVVSYPKET